MQLLSDSDVPKKYHDQLISVFTSDASREEAETKIKKNLGKKNAGYLKSIYALRDNDSFVCSALTD